MSDVLVFEKIYHCVFYYILHLDGSGIKIYEHIIVNLLDQPNAQFFTCITYIAPTYFGVQDTIFREHVMPSVRPNASRGATCLCFHILYVGLVISHKIILINIG
jgi:hypothetical protein